MANNTAYIAEYKRKHVKRIALEIPLEGAGKLTYSEFLEALEMTGEKANTFIKRAIEERIERLKLDS